MRRRPVYSGQFLRDAKRAQKRGKDMDKLKMVMGCLLLGRPLPASCRDHPLNGRWSNHRDAHVEPDWLLIYRVDDDVVRYERTGSHAEVGS